MTKLDAEEDDDLEEDLEEDMDMEQTEERDVTGWGELKGSVNEEESGCLTGVAGGSGKEFSCRIKSSSVSLPDFFFRELRMWLGPGRGLMLW